MNSNRQLGITTAQQSKSTEKLSSGYKINRAADDAAGLSISEKMRRQIRGLDRASTNAQDGVSAVQTAEGALNEVHDMLQRMNELANQAANGTNSLTDRQSIQDEISQLNTEIDRVSETTKFNELYLMKGAPGTKEIMMNGHDAGLKGTLSDTGDTATFTAELTTDMDVQISGKTYHIYDDKDTLKAFQDQVDSADTVSINGTIYTRQSAGAAEPNASAAANKRTSAANRLGSAATIEASAASIKACASKMDACAAGKQGCAAGKKGSAAKLKACATKKAASASGKEASAANLKSCAAKIKACAAGKKGCAAVKSESADKLQACADNKMQAACDKMKAACANTNAASAAALEACAAALEASAGKIGACAGKVRACADGKTACAEAKKASADKVTACAGKKTACAETKRASADKISACAGKKTACAEAKSACAEVKKASAEALRTCASNKVGSADLKRACADALNASARALAGEGDDADSVKFKTPDREYLASELKAMIVDGAKVGINGAQARTAVDTDNNKDNITMGQALDNMKYALKQANLVGVDDTTEVSVSDATQEGNNYAFTINKGSVTVANDLSFDLHVGADADMTNKIGVNISVMSSKYLGVQGLQVADDSGIMATYAIDAVEDAIQKVNEQRSALGAVQNRLEHTINNLDNVVENTTAAESRIRDTDIAEEMVKYSKNNILAQAGQSMLAQANQSTQGALSLLG
jgi:flagellin-like hook-associated protein FlgL